MSAKIQQLEDRIAKCEAALFPKDAEPKKRGGKAVVKGAKTSKVAEGSDGE